MRGAAISLPGCTLSACGSMEWDAQKRLFDQVTDREEIVLAGISYDVAFKPFGSHVNETPEGELIAIGLDAGSPRLDIRRSDGTALGRSDIDVARNVAKLACEQNSDWRRTHVFGPGLEVKDGTVSFMEVCE